MLKLWIPALLLACLAAPSCQSADPKPRNDIEPQAAPVDSAVSARYFNNCGIVIRPAVQYEISYLITDQAVSGRDYVEELTLFISIPAGRGGKLSVHGTELGKNEPSSAAEFPALPEGLHSVSFQLMAQTRAVSWRVNGQGDWLTLNGTSGTYNSKSPFKKPEDLPSLAVPMSGDDRLRPFKPIEIDLYGVKGTIYLHDAK